MSATTDPSHPHFSEDAFKFLRGLKRHNDRVWFEERKPVYEHELKEPMLAVVGEINAGFERFAPQYVRPPQKAVMRIYRDIRFSKEKIPYKTNMAAWWAREGLEKTSGGGFYLQVGPEQVLVAGGCYMPERDQLLAIRRHLMEHASEFRKLMGEKKLAKMTEPFDGLKLTRAPKGFPPEHPAMDLLLAKQWGVSAQLDPKLALEAGFVAHVVELYQLMLPLVEFLNTPLVGKGRVGARL